MLLFRYALLSTSCSKFHNSSSNFACIKFSRRNFAEGVIDLFLIYAGNGGFQYFYYLKDDGSLKSFCVDCVWDDELEIKNENIKNVVSIGQVSDESSYDALATDIDGNVYVMR